MITYEINQSEINRIINNITKLGRAISSKDILERVIVGIKNRIILRTQSGKDKNLKGFVSYSDKYKAKKRTGVVNLTLHGDMINSITQSVMSNDTARIFFNSAEQRNKALGHIKGANYLPVRDFFGVNTKDREYTLSNYQSAIKKAKADLRL